MDDVICQLCRLHPAIENSHVIPRLIYRAIKSDSPTGRFRNPNKPNKPVQDGDKVALLCTECEGRFNVVETRFANDLFHRFHCEDQDQFSYGPWLHYFMASLAWRTLVLDLPDLEFDVANPRRVIGELGGAAETMRNYLLGATHLGAIIRIHVFFQTKATSASLSLARIGPNATTRRSTFGYTILDQSHGYSGVLHNLAGIFCFLIIKGNPRDVWMNTKVSSAGGEIGPPQKVSSWLAAELMETLVDTKQRLTASVSEIQRQKVVAATAANPAAASLRFQQLDARLVAED